MDLDTDTVEYDGVEMRVYQRDDNEWPSVSEIRDYRPTPDRDKSIQGWKNWLEGQPDRPNPDDVLSYKGWRGTLAHYKSLNPLAAQDLAGDDELEAYEGLKGWQYRHDDALSQAEDDVEWFVDQFRQMATDRGIARFDGDTVADSTVRAVEQAILDRDVGYAGRYDLAYDHPERGTTLADLKTSNANSVDDLIKKKWPDYGLQLAAYARGAPFEVDAVEVLWASPDKREASVITEDMMPKSRDEYEEWFLDLAEQFHDEYTI